MPDGFTLTGHILLATPGMPDPRFARAAVLICRHDGDGALGINRSRAHDRIALDAVFAQLDIDIEPTAAGDGPVLDGGPVGLERGFLIHSADWSDAESIDVDGRWRLSASIEALRAVGEEAGPQRWQLALGYTGWGAGQLEAELHEDGWVPVPATDTLIFDLPPATRWRAGFASIGIDVAHLSALGGHS